MKLITLNIWGGKIFEPLIDFIKLQAPGTDIFCFQEMIFGLEPEVTPVHKARLNIFLEIEKCLPDFIAFKYHAPKEAIHFQDEPLKKGTLPGQAIFIKKDLLVNNHGGFRCYSNTIPNKVFLGGKITGSCQWIDLKIKETEMLSILNLHGLWQQDTHKKDTAERLTQSTILHNFLKTKNGKKILCGDFNLQPDCQSIKILEQNMINLVKSSPFTSTRSSYYSKPDKFADYILISPDITVKHFEVLQDEISDHLPLTLEFE
ncbi:MAG TPA: endonuclease/exonuclease/phosphatase family protein [bacterium]|jgi:exonuclease III|nr:endonuclease/exonuclease/phosphatase family protein [bacterium]